MLSVDHIAPFIRIVGIYNENIVMYSKIRVFHPNSVFIATCCDTMIAKIVFIHDIVNT